jgi:molybdopterin-containing oxidoreductase family membrane subunit
LEDDIADLEEKTFAPILNYSRKFFILLTILILIISIGLIGYYLQLTEGLVVTGMNHRASWGLYMSCFVYFIGISYGGILVSGILRITGAEWRRPITRIAETITVFSLMVGGSMVLIDLGRPDKLMNVFLYGQIQSPILWDVISLNTYLIGSLLYLYLPLIPDIAVCRDRLNNVSRFKKRIYRMLSLGWRGSIEQKKLLDKAITMMAIIMIPVAISVHTIVGWIYGMTLRPGWHSTIFGPYFVTGAIFTGVSCIIITMAVIRKVYHLEKYLTEKHFNYLGLLLLVLTLAIIYMTVSEYLTTWYGGEELEMPILEQKFSGRYAPMFWLMVVGGFILPAVVLTFKRGRTVMGTVFASVFVNIGMFLERYLIVIPTMTNPMLPYEEVTYVPSWVEASIILLGFAIIILGIMVFIKFFPVISIWEMKEGIEIEKKIEGEYKKPPKERVPLEETKSLEIGEMEELFHD